MKTIRQCLLSTENRAILMQISLLCDSPVKLFICEKAELQAFVLFDVVVARRSSGRRRRRRRATALQFRFYPLDQVQLDKTQSVWWEQIVLWLFLFFYKMETSCKGGAEEKRTAAENGVIQRSRIKTVSEISCNFKTSPRRLTFLSSLKPPAEAVDLPSISPTKSAINCMKI